MRWIAVARLAVATVALWPFVAASSHAQSAAVPAPELGAIAWIAGHWVGHQGEAAPGGSDIDMDVRWAPNKRALFMDLTLVRAGSSQPYMSAIYYWHPGTRAITMWQILSGGTVNDGRVVAATDAGLTQELRATDPDGTTRLLQTTFAHDRPDQFVFTSSSRVSTNDPWVTNAPIRFARPPQSHTSSPFQEY